VFRFIEHVEAQPRNNATQLFSHYADIESWLREQWAGLFRDLLGRAKEQVQLRSLQEQVIELAELNRTMKTYLEEVVYKVSPATSRELILTETKRLEDARLSRLLDSTDMGDFLLHLYKLNVDQVRELFDRSDSFDEFCQLLLSLAPDADLREVVEYWMESESEFVIYDYAKLRELFSTLQSFPELKNA